MLRADNYMGFARATSVVLARLVFVLFIGVSVASVAQFELPVMSVRGAAMGGTSVALDDAASSLCNIAALARRSGYGAALSYRNDFMMAATSHKWVAAYGSLTPTGTVIATYHHYGGKTYNEQRLSAGYAQAVGNNISIGATMDYLYSGVSDGYYDAVRALTFTASMQFSLGRSWTMGARVSNPAAVKAGSNRLPVVLNIGTAWQTTTDFLTTIEIEKTIYSPATLRVGAEYCFLNHFAARVGIVTHPVECCFGVGANYGRYGIDLSVAVHQLLGITSQIGLSATF